MSKDLTTPILKKSTLPKESILTETPSFLIDQTSLNQSSLNQSLHNATKGDSANDQARLEQLLQSWDEASGQTWSVFFKTTVNTFLEKGTNPKGIKLNLDTCNIIIGDSSSLIKLEMGGGNKVTYRIINPTALDDKNFTKNLQDAKDILKNLKIEEGEEELDITAGANPNLVAPFTILHSYKPDKYQNIGDLSIMPPFNELSMFTESFFDDEHQIRELFTNPRGSKGGYVSTLLRDLFHHLNQDRAANEKELISMKDVHSYIKPELVRELDRPGMVYLNNFVFEMMALYMCIKMLSGYSNVVRGSEVDNVAKSHLLARSIAKTHLGSFAGLPQVRLEAFEDMDKAHKLLDIDIRKFASLAISLGYNLSKFHESNKNKLPSDTPQTHHVDNAIIKDRQLGINDGIGAINQLRDSLDSILGMEQTDIKQLEAETVTAAKTMVENARYWESIVYPPSLEARVGDKSYLQVALQRWAAERALPMRYNPDNFENALHTILPLRTEVAPAQQPDMSRETNDYKIVTTEASRSQKLLNLLCYALCCKQRTTRDTAVVAPGTSPTTSHDPERSTLVESLLGGGGRASPGKDTSRASVSV